MLRISLFLLAAAVSIAAQTPGNRPLRIIAFGAHPDDAELKFASHRPWDYHADHRAAGKLAKDAAVVVVAPFFSPYTPATPRNPIFLFYSDPFLKPYPFDPIIAVGIDEVAQKKWDCIRSMPSQFGDADS